MQKPKYTVWVTYYVKHYWYLILLLVVLTIGAVLLDLMGPLPLKFLADNVFGHYPPPHFLPHLSKSGMLLLAAIGYVVIYSSQTLYGFMQSIIARKFNQFIDRVSLQESYLAATKLAYNDSDRLDDGTYLYQITSQSQQMSEYLFTNFVSIAQSVLLLIGVIVVLARINLRIMLITFVITPLLGVCVVYFGKVLERKANETETAHAEIYSFIEESLAKLRTVQSFVLGNKRLLALNKLVDIRNKKAVSQQITSELFDSLVDFIILGGVAVAIYAGGLSVFAGTMTFGDLLIFIAYVNNVFGQVSNIIQTIGDMKIQAAALQQAYDTISDSTATHIQTGTLASPIDGSIIFKDVTITQKGTVVVQNVNLSIAPRSVVAFVGLSGSGKTTLFNALLRFIEPSEGVIFVSQHNIRDYDTDFLRQHIALIEQEPDLFDETVSNNIAIAEQNRDFQLLDVIGAAKAANATDFVEALPDKYDAVIDNHKLSGGQKQRIAVARAFYKQAPIVLMDEPTSALDKEAAALFIQNVTTYFHDATILIITHDLSLLSQIPNIYVVKDHTVKPISDYGGLQNYAAEIVDASSAVA